MNLPYDMPLFRPPSEGYNLIIQATLGCSFNQYSLCCMYRSKQFVERPLDEVFADIRHAAAGWPDAHRAFLADGDALALPTDHLLAIHWECVDARPATNIGTGAGRPGDCQNGYTPFFSFANVVLRSFRNLNGSWRGLKEAAQRFIGHASSRCSA